MALISYLCRRGARYHYRRRLFLRKLVNEHISIPLKTADPAEARRLAARLSVRWDVTKMIATGQALRGYLTASESIAVFKQSLDQELGLATAARYDGDGLDERTPRVFEAAYRIAARLDASATSISSELLEAHSKGFSAEDRRAVAVMLKVVAPHTAAAAEAERTLTAINAPLNAATIRDARVQILLAKAEAQARAQMIMHPLVSATGNPLSRLVDDDAVAAIRREASPTPPPASAPTPGGADEFPYMTMDRRRFSEIIERTIAAIQRSGDWNEDTKQRRTAMRAFAWARGDKRLCDYRPEDAEFFGQVLEHLPKTFHWGTPEQGAMSRPFAEVLAEIPKAQDSEKRSHEPSIATSRPCHVSLVSSPR